MSGVGTPKVTDPIPEKDKWGYCKAHFLSVIKYDKRFPCPLCEAERRTQELAQVANGQAMTVTVRLDNSTIPPIVDAAVDELRRIRGAQESIATSLQDINRKLNTSTTDDPLCPKCNSEMIVKERRDKTGKFWSCIDYPKCKGTRQYNVKPSQKPTGNLVEM